MATTSHSQLLNKKKPPAQSHSRKQPNNHIPRPRNAFILFRTDFVQSKKMTKEVESDHRNISKIVGQIWRALPLDQKKQWHEKAQYEKERHSALHPGYKYAPTTRREPPIRRHVKHKVWEGADDDEDVGAITQTVDTTSRSTPSAPIQSTPHSSLGSFSPAESQSSDICISPTLLDASIGGGYARLPGTTTDAPNIKKKPKDRCEVIAQLYLKGIHGTALEEVVKTKEEEGRRKRAMEYGVTCPEFIDVSASFAKGTLGSGGGSVGSCAGPIRRPKHSKRASQMRPDAPFSRITDTAGDSHGRQANKVKAIPRSRAVNPPSQRRTCTTGLPRSPVLFSSVRSTSLISPLSPSASPPAPMTYTATPEERDVDSCDFFTDVPIPEFESLVPSPPPTPLMQLKEALKNAEVADAYGERWSARDSEKAPTLLIPARAPMTVSILPRLQDSRKIQDLIPVTTATTAGSLWMDPDTVGSLAEDGCDTLMITPTLSHQSFNPFLDHHTPTRTGLGEYPPHSEITTPAPVSVSNSTSPLSRTSSGFIQAQHGIHSPTGCQYHPGAIEMHMTSPYNLRNLSDPLFDHLSTSDRCIEPTAWEAGTRSDRPGTRWIGRRMSVSQPTSPLQKSVHVAQHGRRDDLFNGTWNQAQTLWLPPPSYPPEAAQQRVHQLDSEDWSTTGWELLRPPSEPPLGKWDSEVRKWEAGGQWLNFGAPNAWRLGGETERLGRLKPILTTFDEDELLSQPVMNSIMPHNTESDQDTPASATSDVVYLPYTSSHSPTQALLQVASPVNYAGGTLFDLQNTPASLVYQYSSPESPPSSMYETPPVPPTELLPGPEAQVAQSARYSYESTSGQTKDTTHRYSAGPLSTTSSEGDVMVITDDGSSPNLPLVEGDILMGGQSGFSFFMA
ncbi:hypothetical protein FRB95_000633 [Tulasnella sp. JGI-2019a]|nr:hypothetical protein FRB95_000633 [Tulasnella sp. JGI-2019a]